MQEIICVLDRSGSIQVADQDAWEQLNILVLKHCKVKRNYYIDRG